MNQRGTGWNGSSTRKTKAARLHLRFCRYTLKSVVANGRGIEVPPQSAGEMRLKPLIVRLLTSAFRYQYREVGLWEVISAVGIDDRQITGDSEVINLDRKPGQLLEAQSTLDGV